jgi:uncharacterized protein YndB with AHSA1/START domain
MTTVERTEHFEATPEELWPLVSEPDALAEWLDADVELEARPGGRVHVVEPDGLERVGVVHRVVPHERIEFTWTVIDGDATPSVVSFELVPDDDGGGTDLRITETRLGLDRLDLPFREYDGFDALARA